MEIAVDSKNSVSIKVSNEIVPFQVEMLEFSTGTRSDS